MIVTALRELLIAQPFVVELVAQRVHPRQLPDAPTFDAIVLTKVYGRGEHDMAGGTALEEARVQLDYFTERGQEALEAAVRQVRRFLHGYTGPTPVTACGIQRAACINSMDMTESLTERAGPRLRRHLLEFSIWNTET